MAVRTSSRDQSEMKGARWAMGSGIRVVKFFLSLRFLREFYAPTCCDGFKFAA